MRPSRGRGGGRGRNRGRGGRYRRDQGSRGQRRDVHVSSPRRFTDPTRSACPASEATKTVDHPHRYPHPQDSSQDHWTAEREENSPSSTPNRSKSHSQVESVRTERRMNPNAKEFIGTAAGMGMEMEMAPDMGQPMYMANPYMNPYAMMPVDMNGMPMAIPPEYGYMMPTMPYQQNVVSHEKLVYQHAAASSHAAYARVPDQTTASDDAATGSAANTSEVTEQIT